MRVLVAGAGDLGTRIAVGLRTAGCTVTAVARHARSDGSVVACDLTRPCRDALPDTFDLLVHCLSPAQRDPDGYRAVYVDALRHLLDALPSLQRVAFVSSTAVYGDHQGGWVDEASDCRPQGFNGRILLEAEQLAQASGQRALLLRAGGLYGPGRDMLLRRVRSGQPLAMFEPPLYTNRIHIEDAAAAAVHLLLRGEAGIFNLVDDAPAAQPEVLDWLADQLQWPRLPRVPGSTADENKRVANARLHASGFALRHPDFRSGYAALLR